MATMTEIEKLQKLTGESDNELLSLVYDDAKAAVLAYTNRTVLPEVLMKDTRDIAVILLNRIGTEGEKERSEAGERYVFDDMTVHITANLNRYRLARVGGITYEYKPEDASQQDADDASDEANNA